MEDEFDPNKIVDEYANTIFYIALGYVKNSYDAEDIVQEVLLKYIKYINTHGNFKDKDYEKYWIVRVAINLSRNEIKSARRKHNVPLDENCSKLEFEIAEQFDLMQEIKSLKQKYREVFELYYLQDFKISEISKILKISESNVKIRLKRAKEKLKESLDRRQLNG
jgi:RNA polymerase sigma-70 factor (ECF subfamily)